MFNKTRHDTARKAKTEPAFDPVSAALKQLHDSVQKEAVPDEFLRILDDIDAKIAASMPKLKASDDG